MIPRQKPQSFTIVEMLVACVLLTIVMAIILAALSGSTSLTAIATRHLITTRTARESLDEIGRELSLASVPWQRTSWSSLELLINPTYVPSQDANPDTIFWQAPLAHTNNFGNQAVVGYFVLRDLQASAPSTSRLQLRKVFIPPTPPASPGNYLIYSTPNAWMTAALVDNFAPTTSASDFSNAEEGWVADGVLGLWVRCLDKLNNPITVNSAGSIINSSSVNTYDSRSAYKQVGNQTTSYYSYSTNFCALPAYVEVSMACVSPAEVVRITSLPKTPTSNAINFDAPIDAYVQSVMASNPGVKSVTKFSRIFRLYESD